MSGRTKVHGPCVKNAHVAFWPKSEAQKAQKHRMKVLCVDRYAMTGGSRNDPWE